MKFGNEEACFLLDPFCFIPSSTIHSFNLSDFLRPCFTKRFTQRCNQLVRNHGRLSLPAPPSHHYPTTTRTINETFELLQDDLDAQTSRSEDELLNAPTSRVTVNTQKSQVSVKASQDLQIEYVRKINSYSRRAYESPEKSSSLNFIHQKLEPQKLKFSSESTSWIEAYKYFRTCPNPNVYVWTSIIAVLGREGQWKLALNLMHEMRTGQCVVDDDGNINIPLDTGDADAGRGIAYDFSPVSSVAPAFKNKVIVPNYVTYGAVISACAAASQWIYAMKLLYQMRQLGIRPNTSVFNACVSACERGNQWPLAYQLLQEMKLSHVPRDAVTYASLITACGRFYHEKNPDQASTRVAKLFREMIDRDNVKPDIVCYNAVLASYSLSGLWREAFQFMRDEMIKNGFEPNTISYNNCIRACRLGGEYESALALFAKMKEQGVVPDIITYSTCISVCEKIGRWKEALNLLKEMSEEGIIPNMVCMSCCISACEKAYEPQMARKILLKMHSMGMKVDHIAYSACMRAHRKVGDWKTVIVLLKEMRAHNIRLDRICYDDCIMAAENLGYGQLVHSLEEERNAGNFVGKPFKKIWRRWRTPYP